MYPHGPSTPDSAMDRDTLFSLPLAEKLGEQGMELAASSDRAWSWRSSALAAIHELAATGMPFTADDVVARVGLPSSGVNQNNAVGAVIRTAAMRGWIVKTGAYRKSRRVLGHGRVIAVWAGSPDWDPS